MAQGVRKPESSECPSGNLSLTPEDVFIGFGSNQGDSLETCRDAIEVLRSHPRIEIIRVSSFYRSKPVGPVEQDWFINGVLLCRSSLEPGELLRVLHEVEDRFGRKRALRWGPRTLDLDMLAYGARRISAADLTVPHPRLHERLFVLAPLAEIAAGWSHPETGLTVEELLRNAALEAPDQEIEKLGMNPWAVFFYLQS